MPNTIELKENPYKQRCAKGLKHTETRTKSFTSNIKKYRVLFLFRYELKKKTTTTTQNYTQNHAM